jgi:hypothetical protein
MPTGPRSISRSASVLAGIAFAIGALAAACTPSQPSSGDHPVGPSGFPLGTFSKEMSDPELGRVRFVWDFEPDGRYAEIPLALDGQTLLAPTVRGRYTVDGSNVTIATDYPPDWGTSRHAWRMDGDVLWTVFLDSNVPEDKDWFEGLDSRPWTPYP